MPQNERLVELPTIKRLLAGIKKTAASVLTTPPCRPLRDLFSVKDDSMLTSSRHHEVKIPGLFKFENEVKKVSEK